MKQGRTKRFSIRSLLLTALCAVWVFSTIAFVVACDFGQEVHTEPAENTVTELTIENWTYGEQAKTPVATSTHGTIVFTYSTAADGEFTTTVPTDAGTYYVKASVAATDEYAAAEKIVSFTINKATNNVLGFDAINGIECHGTPALSATAVSGGITYTYAVSENGEYGNAPEHFTAGTYYVKATSEANKNYSSVSVVKTLTVSHRATEKVDAAYLKSEADCAHYAEYYKSCELCGAKIEAEDFQYIDGGYGAHKSVSHKSEVAATCHSVGYTAGDYCSDCGEYVSGHEIINMTAHNWVPDTAKNKAPNCTENGVNAFKCDNDGCTETKTEVGDAATGHIVTNWTKTGETKVPGTHKCEYQITYTGTCESCGAPIIKTETAEKHNFYYSVTEEPTCQGAGVKTEYCLDEDCEYHTKAHATEPYPLPAGADGHDWVETATSGTWECSHCHDQKTVISENSDKIENVNADTVKAVDEIELSTASVKLDDGVKDKLGSTVSISAEAKDKDKVNTDNLTPEQKEQFNNAKAVYDFTLKSDGESIDKFGENNYITIKIPYELQAGDNPDKIVVWCVKDDGTLESFDASYANGYITFKTNHFSVYTVVEMTAEEYCAKNNCHTAEYVNANPDKFLVIDPTCTLGGYTVCLNCGEIILKTDAAGHKWHSETVTAVSCTENGQVHHECSVCGMNYETYTPATGHYYIISEQAAATCTERGSVTYECTHCGDSYTVYTAKLEHKYTVETVEATCTTDGYTKRTCHLCGAETVTNYVPALGHVYGNEWVKSADGHYHVCTRCGEADELHAHIAGAEATELTAQICTECGYILNAPIGHVCKNHLKEVAATEADCLSGGNLKYYVCDCGKWYSDEDAEQLIVDHLTVYTDALGHTAEQRVAVDPTCEDVGYTAGVWCNRCNKWVKGHVEIPASGHSYNATVSKPTCTKGGKTTYTCADCGHTYEGNFTVALGHNHVATVHAPDCTHGGYTDHVCSVCGDKYTDGETAPLGHNVSTVWSKDGEYHWHVCGRCGEISDKAAHTPDYAEATELHGISCTACGYQIAERLDHTHHGEKHNAVAPTCTSGGSKEYYVCDCGDWFFDEDCTQKVINKTDLMIPASGHTAVHYAKHDATCVEIGYTEGYYCTVCEQWISGHKVIAIDPNNHKHVTHHAVVAPSCTEDGTIEYWTCNDCEKDFFDADCINEITDKTALVVDSLGHNYNDDVTAPDCTHGGYTTHICSRCGDSYVDEETAPLGHDYGEATYVWSDDNTTCTATRVCGRDGAHTETETAKAVTTVTQERSCEKDEFKTFTVTFDNSAFKSQIKENVKTAEKFGHDYKSVVIKPDCTHGGYTTHTCSYCGDSYVDEETKALGHEYGAPTYVWSDDNATCTATRVCVRDKNHIETEQAQVTARVVQERSCIDDELTTYVATFKNAAFEMQTKASVKTADAYEHTSSAWESDENGHYHICSKCQAKYDESAHTPDYAEATTEHGITCTVCGYVMAEPIKDEQPKPVYTFSDVFTELDGMEITCVLNSDFKISGRFTVNGETESFAGSWTRGYDEETQAEYVECNVFGLYFLFDIVDGKLVPFIYQPEDESDIIYRTTYKGVEIRFFENEYDFICGTCQFYSDYQVKDDVIRIVFIGEDVKFKVNADNTLSVYEEEHGEDPQERTVVYTYHSVAVMHDTTITFDFVLYSDFTSVVITDNDIEHSDDGTWKNNGENTVCVEFQGMEVWFTVRDGNLTPIIKTGEAKYQTELYGMTALFYEDGVYTIPVGDYQFVNYWNEREGKVYFEYGGDKMVYAVSEDGKTLVPYEGHGEDPQDTTLYSYDMEMSAGGGSTVTIRFEFYEDYTAKLTQIMAGQSQEMPPCSWKYDEEGRVYISIYGTEFLFVIGEDGKTLTPYEEEIDSEIVYVTDYYGMKIKFYENGEFITSGGYTIKGTWSYLRGYVVAVFDEEPMFFTVNPDGKTVAEVEDITQLYVYRVAIKRSNGEIISTYPITLDENGDSVTPITLTERAYVKIEKSYDLENYIDNSSNDYMYDAGEYEVHYSIEPSGNGGYHSSFSVANLNEYQGEYIGSLVKNGDKFFRHDDESGDKDKLVEIEYTIENGIYAFDCSFRDGYGTLYFTLGENRKFKAYVPQSDALYTYSRDYCTVKLYEGGYVAVYEGSSVRTTTYFFTTKEENDTVVIETSDFVGWYCPLWFMSNGKLADGWQEGDIAVEVKINNINMYGNNRFVVGTASLSDIHMMVYYTDGSEKLIDGTELTIEQEIDFNARGEYRIDCEYQGVHAELWFEIGYANDVYGRGLSNYSVVWLVDENGNVLADFSYLSMYESVFGGNGNTVKLDESCFNAADVAAARRGKSGDTFEIRSNYTHSVFSSEYVTLRVVLLSMEDINEAVENVNVRGELVYLLDEGRYLTTSYVAQMIIDVNVEFERVEYGKEGEQVIRKYWEQYSYIKLITPDDLVIEENNDFRKATGKYKVKVFVAVDSENEYDVTVVSAKASDITFMSAFSTNNGMYTLPSAQVGESTESYRTRFVKTLNEDQVRYNAVWMLMNYDVTFNYDYVSVITEGTFDFSDFDASKRGTTYIRYSTVDYNGNPYVTNISITVAA